MTGIGTHTRQRDNPNTEDQHTKVIGLEPNFKKPFQISAGTQLQHDIIQDQEDIITIQLESPECNILGVNPAPKNESYNST